MTADRHEVKVTGPVQGLVIGDNNTVTLVFQTGERRTVPFLAPPKPSHAFIGRESLFDHLKSRLIDDNGVKLVALQGLPGVGKTALAVALAHAPDLLSRFTDGVLWAGLGREPLVQSELARWGTALGLSQVELADLKKTSDLPRAIHAAIGMSRMLLVVDDAWEAEAALALRLGGPHCAQIFTTRLPQVAVKLANTLTNVPELSAGDSLELFGQFVPSIVHNEPKEACDLVRVVGGLPLALTLMGKYLRSEMQGGQPRRVQVALHKLHAAEQRLRLSEPQSPLEHHPSLAESVPISLYAVISVSEEALKKKQRNALRSLALFPSKPTTFSEEAALATADASTSDLDALADSGLLESGGAGRYAIHQTISDYGKIRNCDSASFERMCEFFVSFVEGHQKDFRALEIEGLNILEALKISETRGLNGIFLRGTVSFYPFLEVRGLYEVAEMLLNSAHTLARQANDINALALALVYLARIAGTRSNYEIAEKRLQESLVLTERADEKLRIVVLRDLGSLLIKRARYSDSEKYLLEGLELARKSVEREKIAALLLNLGALEGARGRFTEANDYLRQALSSALEIQHTEYIAKIQQNLGGVASARGRFEEATEHTRGALESAKKLGNRRGTASALQNLAMVENSKHHYADAEPLGLEALDLYRQIGDREGMSATLQILSRAVGRLGRHEQAESFVQQALVIAREIDDERRISGALSEYGERLFEHGKPVEAVHQFREAVAIGRKINNLSCIAEALYAWARTVAAQGDFASARQMAAESYALFEASGDNNAVLVKAWLATLRLRRFLSFFSIFRRSRVR